MWVRCYKCAGGFVTSAGTIVGVGSLLQVRVCGFDSWCGFVVTSAGTVVGVDSLLQVRVR